MPRFALLTAGVIALILYGSLYPFQFRACVGSLFGTPPVPTDRGDLLANILFYMPLGFFARLAWRRKGGLLFATALGVALSFAVESLQPCITGRVPALSDLIANSAGALAGALIAASSVGPAMNFAGLLSACWIGSRLFPFLPSLNPHKFASALRIGTPSPLQIFYWFALWLAACLALELVVGRPRWRVPLLIAAVLLARIVIIDLSLTLDEIAGASLAILFWLILPPNRWRTGLVTLVFIAYVATQALQPFKFLPTPRPFGWIPFLAFIESPRESATRVFLEKSFTYGALVWLGTRIPIPFSAAAILSTALVLALRVAQTYLPGRSAEITDALMVFMLAATLNAMQKETAIQKDVTATVS